MTDDARLADIHERIDRIARATAAGPESFRASEVIQDAVIGNLEVIGEAAKGVSPATRRELALVPWRAMARFRDLAIHPYGRVLSEEVWNIVEKYLPEIRKALAIRTSHSGVARGPRSGRSHPRRTRESDCGAFPPATLGTFLATPRRWLASARLPPAGNPVPAAPPEVRLKCNACLTIG